MPTAKTASARGLAPHWKIRVAFPGSIFHLASLTEPEIRFDGDRVVGLVADLIKVHDYGDTVGYINWPEVVAVTWRYAPGDRKPEGAVDPDRAPKWAHEVLHELRQPALSHGASQTFLGDLLHTNKAALTRGLTWLLERDQVRKHPGPGGSYRYVATERAPGPSQPGALAPVTRPTEA